MTAAAKPKPAFAPDPGRRAMIAKLHIAKAQLGLSDDDYRAVLLRETSRMSAADCTPAELDRALKAFERQGFSAKARSSAPKAADHPVAKKARALWISLHQLGAIDDPSERALEAMARRMLGCERMQWANRSLCWKLIEALKAIGARHGWDQSMTGAMPASVIVLKRRLIDAIFAKLLEAGAVPGDWTKARAAFEFGGVEIESIIVATLPELDLVAQVLGRALRETKLWEVQP